MKKRILNLGLVMMLMASVWGTFAACSSDNEEASEPQTITAKAVYSFTPTADLVSVADVTISYADAAGATQTVTCTSATEWTVTIEKTAPCSFSGFTVKTAMKSGVTLDKTGYELGYTYKYTVSSTNARMDGASEIYTIAAADVESALGETVTYGAFSVSEAGFVQ